MKPTYRDLKEFRERVITQRMTPEYLDEMVDGDDALIRQRAEWAADQFEASFNAVVEVERHEDYGRYGYSFYIIPGRTANRDALKHGVQHLYHWISEGRDADG